MADTSHLVAVIGEAVWDQYPQRRYLGGAAVNTARHIRRLGHSAAVLSRVGDDEPGRAIRSALAGEHIDASGIQIDSRYPTGEVKISLTEGQVLFRCKTDCAFDHFADFAPWLAQNGPMAAVLFSLFCQRHADSRTQIQRALMSEPADLVVFDADMTAPFAGMAQAWEFGIEHSHAVKLSENTWPAMNQALGFSRSDEVSFLRHLVARGFLKCVCMTLNERGVLAVTRSDTFYQPGLSAVVVDPVGAGDAFLAGLTVSMLCGRPLPAALAWATALAAHVCTHEGAFLPYEPAEVARRARAEGRAVADRRFERLMPGRPRGSAMG